MGNKGSKVVSTSSTSQQNSPPQQQQNEPTADTRVFTPKPARPTPVAAQNANNNNSTINSSDIQVIKKSYDIIESLCKVSPNPVTIQNEIDKLFDQVHPNAYKALVSAPQGTRHNLLRAILKAPSSPTFSDEHLFQLILKNEMLIPSCSPQTPLFQTLSSHLKRPQANQFSLPLLECLLNRVESNTFDTLFSIYCTFDEYIQQTSGVYTEQQFTTVKLLLDWLDLRVKSFEIPLGHISPPVNQDGSPYYLSIYHIHLIGAKFFHKVHVPPLFHLIRSPVDNIIFRTALEYIITIYGYDLYNPLATKREVISDRLLYPYHCLFHAPVVGASSQLKPIYRDVINLNDELTSPGVPQSRSGSTCSFLSQQTKIFSLDLLIFLIHLATKDQIRAIHLYHNSIPSTNEVGTAVVPEKKPVALTMNDSELYKELMAATHKWLHLLSSSYGVPTLATAIGNGLALNEKILQLQSGTNQGENATTTFETFTEGTAKFIVSMINTYKSETLLFDAMSTPKQEKKKKDEFETAENDSEEAAEELTYTKIAQIFSYNPFPLLLLVRYIVWLFRAAPDLVHQDVIQYLHLFMGQLIPSTFSYFASNALTKQREQLISDRQQLSLEKDQFDPEKATQAHPLLVATQSNYISTLGPRIQALDTTIDALANPNGFATIEDKHRLALSKYVKLWPVYEEALHAYTSLDNSLPLYTETTLTISELWLLVSSYNYDDVSSLQLLFNPFFLSMTFPQYSLGMSSQLLNVSDALLSLGFCQNVYVNPFLLVPDPLLYAKNHAKYPTLMMRNSAFGGSGQPRVTVRAFPRTSFSTKLSSTPSEFIPFGIYGNVLGSMMLQFPAVYTCPFPTALPLSDGSLAYHLALEMVDESSSLQQQLAFTRNILETMTKNNLQQNISLYLYVINIIQLLFYQMSMSLSDTQNLLIKTQISVALNQIKNYVDKTGSLFLPVSAEDKPMTSFNNSIGAQSRPIPTTTIKMLTRFTPPASSTPQFDIYSNPQRRQAFLQQQLPVMLQTMLSIFSSGQIWSILTPNLNDVLNSETGYPGVNGGESLARIQHLYSLVLLTMFQSICLQSYIVEQQENIITQPLDLAQINTLTLTPAQQLASATLTYLCYLPPMVPNSFGTSLISCFFRLADAFFEKLTYLVSQSAGGKDIDATIAPIEYFCAILCYQPLVYTVETCTQFYTTAGAISTTEEVDLIDASKLTGSQIAEQARNNKKKQHSVDAVRLFGHRIRFSWDASAYDEALVGTPLPVINNPFLWLFYQSKAHDRFQYKRAHLTHSLEQYLQQHFHITTLSQTMIAKLESAHHEQPYLPSTAQLMYYLDYTIGSLTRFYQSTNHYSGYSSAFPVAGLVVEPCGSKDDAHLKKLGVSNYFTKNEKFTTKTISSCVLPQDRVKPYQASGLLAFLMDACYKPSIDEIFFLCQGIGMSEITLDFIKHSSDPTAFGFADAEDSTLENFKLVQPIQYQFERTVATPSRPYTFTAFLPDHAIFSDTSIFAGIIPKHGENLMNYFKHQFASNSPQSLEHLDIPHLAAPEYEASLANEIIVNAILRRNEPSILMALVNQCGTDALFQYNRPMYIFSRQDNAWVHANWNIVDIMTAVGTNLYASDFFNFIKSSANQ